MRERTTVQAGTFNAMGLRIKRCAVAVVVTVSAGCSNDRVHTSSFTGSDAATVVVNGRRDGACSDYQLYLGTTPVGVGNLQASSNCLSEVAVFASSNAMGLLGTVGRWTDASSDEVTVPMRGPFAVPLNVFIMSGDYVQHSVEVREAEAANDIATAVQMYDANQC